LTEENEKMQIKNLDNEEDLEERDDELM